MRRGRGRSIAISSRMRPGPALITTTRSASSTASSMWWVTKMIVGLNSSHTSSRKRCISTRVWKSSAANGSSIMMKSGFSTSARAIATRCFMPPESWCGRWRANFVSRTRSSSRSTRASRSARGTPFTDRPKPTLSRTDSHGNSECSWNTITTPGSGPATGLPSNAMRPEESGSSPAISSSSVLLPQPLGPRMATNSPCCTVRSTSFSAVTDRPPGEVQTLPTCWQASVFMATGCHHRILRWICTSSASTK